MRRIGLILLGLMLLAFLGGCAVQVTSPIEDALNAVATNLGNLVQTLTIQSWLQIGALFFLILFAFIVLRRQAANNDLLVKNHMTSQVAFTLYLLKKDGIDPKSLKKDLAQLHDFLLEGDTKPRKRKTKRKAKSASKKTAS